MKMNYEEYLELVKPIINYMIHKYNYLKTEPEDLRQEAYITLFELMPKLDELDTLQHIKNYFSIALDGKFYQIYVYELETFCHDTAPTTDYFGNDILENYERNETLYGYTNERLENVYAKRRKAVQKWRTEKREDYEKSYHKSYQNHKERNQEYARNYYYEHKEKMQEYARKYKEEHKEELKRKRREKYARKKLEKLEKEGKAV